MGGRVHGSLRGEHLRTPSTRVSRSSDPVACGKVRGNPEGLQGGAWQLKESPALHDRTKHAGFNPLPRPPMCFLHPFLRAPESPIGFSHLTSRQPLRERGTPQLPPACAISRHPLLLPWSTPSFEEVCRGGRHRASARERPPHVSIDQTAVEEDSPGVLGG